MLLQAHCPSASTRLFVPCPHVLRKLKPARATGKEPGVSEAVLERLRKAEAEAEALRKQLAAAKAEKGEGNGAVRVLEDKTVLVSGNVRVDGKGLNRVVPWAGKNAGDWINEGDIESAGVYDPATDADRAELKKRLLIGGLATIALGAFALVPTDSLRIGRPSKPIFLYLVPVIRSQTLLVDLEKVIEEGTAADLDSALRRVAGPPTSLEENVRNAAISLQDPKRREAAERVARDIVEDLDAIDPNKYYDSPSARRQISDGNRARLYADFSLRACKAAQVKVREFLAIFPAEEVSAARDIVTNGSQMSA